MLWELVRIHGPQHQKKPNKTNVQDKSEIFWEVRPENPVFRGPPIELHRLGYSGPIFKTFVFFRFSWDQATPKNDAETATCYHSLQENTPRDHAQIKERPTWRSIARSRALYDQMAPWRCLFCTSEKFDFRPTKQKQKNAETATFHRSLEENSPWEDAQIKGRPT